MSRRSHCQGGTTGQVRDAVATVHATRPAADAPVGAKAVWWARTADALDLIAATEANAARARTARADAATARGLSRGLALTHSTQAGRRDHAAEHTDTDGAAVGTALSPTTHDAGFVDGSATSVADAADLASDAWEACSA